MSEADPTVPICRLGQGPWAVGVSGGADSVALLHLLRYCRPEMHVHVVHLDHQTRGSESAADARFVADLACRFNLPLTLARREQIEQRMQSLPRNRSARYRAVRLELFREVVERYSLAGVLLAHQADDQAETVLHRLLRGATAPYLRGMQREARIGSLLIVRPLLDVPGRTLRAYLQSHGQSWCEDTSNLSMQYGRNRLRRLLRACSAATGERDEQADLSGALLALNEAMRKLQQWVEQNAPELPEEFSVRSVGFNPRILISHALRAWLQRCGCPVEQITPAVVSRLLDLIDDASTSPRQEFPGGLSVRRTAGRIRAFPASS